ncbi:MAG: mechanosensitive ion channel [Chloroflexota bacterium]|nr:mechanosensitive ion channel [Chloroflexota bacterium]
MPNFLQTFVDQLSVSTLNILGALAILIIGWIVALIVAAIIRGVIKKTKLDEKISQWLSKGDGVPVDAAKVVSKAIYYLIMLFVLVAFFQRLGLTMVTQPINAFLTQILEYAPRLLGAGMIALAAWVIATVLKFVVVKALDATNLDERLRSSAGMEDDQTSFSQSIANALFWFIFLLFLPGILGALSMQGLVAPVQGMFSNMLNVIPNIIGAGIILLVGWFVARIVRQVIVNLLAAAGADKLNEKFNLGEQKVSAVVGTVVHALIMIQVVISALDTLGIESISAPATRMLTTVWNGIPALVGAVIVLGISYFIGKWISELISNLLASVGFNKILVWIGLGNEPGEGEQTPSDIMGTLILVGVMMFAAVEAANILGLSIVAELVTIVIGYAGQAIIAVAIFGGGMYLANLTQKVIMGTGVANAKQLSQLARIAIIVLVIAMALGQLGVATEIVNMAFGLLMGAIAVAIALAFGLGSREIAARKVEGWLKAFDDSDEKA